MEFLKEYPSQMSENKAETPETKQAAADTEAAQAETVQAETAQTDATQAEKSTGAEADERAPAGEGDRIALLEAEVAGLKDQLLRALAETENLRRRAQRERSEALKYAAAPLIKDLLVASDNLRRAIESVPEGAAKDEGLLRTLLTGVQLTEKELFAAFDRHKIVKLEPLGEKLDPHRHEAMFEVEDPSQPPGTVVMLLEPGYLLHDRLLRPARVAVAKGGSPAAAKPESDDASTEAAPDKDSPRLDTSA